MKKVSNRITDNIAPSVEVVSQSAIIQFNKGKLSHASFLRKTNFSELTRDSLEIKKGTEKFFRITHVTRQHDSDVKIKIQLRVVTPGRGVGQTIITMKLENSG